MAEESLFLIDVEKILREKARKYYKYIPSFVVSFQSREKIKNDPPIFKIG